MNKWARKPLSKKDRRALVIHALAQGYGSEDIDRMLREQGYRAGLESVRQIIRELREGGVLCRILGVPEMGAAE